MLRWKVRMHACVYSCEHALPTAPQIAAIDAASRACALTLPPTLLRTLFQGKLVYPTQDMQFPVSGDGGVRPQCPANSPPAQYACVPFLVSCACRRRRRCCRYCRRRRRCGRHCCACHTTCCFRP
eukprot:363560-Chlamydomonas_euryale.AAC.20